jgi:hypothetical protein
LFPDITAATYNVPPVERVLTLRIRFNDDINVVFRTVTEHLVGVFGKIKTSF